MRAVSVNLLAELRLVRGPQNVTVTQISVRQNIPGISVAPTRGTLTGNINNINANERRVVNDLLNRGNNVELVPRSNAQGVTSVDFRVNGVPTELKTIQGTSLNTPVTKINRGFDQGAQTVIIDARGTGMTTGQANSTISRVQGIHGGSLPGRVEIWLPDGSIVIGGL